LKASSKRRRTKEECRNDKEREQLEKQEIQAKLAKFE
jgi:hypothetical protein